mmetsp:Transcript_12439/g.20331  ORF Transcript_12439/g.20331 Transcript_12439/m.20331 type:complete len:118 (+) Transcript_12439:3-356(+)
MTFDAIDMQFTSQRHLLKILFEEGDASFLCSAFFSLSDLPRLFFGERFSPGDMDDEFTTVLKRTLFSESSLSMSTKSLIELTLLISWVVIYIHIVYKRALQIITRISSNQEARFKQW